MAGDLQEHCKNTFLILIQVNSSKVFMEKLFPVSKSSILNTSTSIQLKTNMSTIILQGDTH